jgi:hypothetical protein
MQFSLIIIILLLYSGYGLALEHYNPLELRQDDSVKRAAPQLTKGSHLKLID